MAAKSSRIWFAAHGWLGLPLWALMVFVCLTGSVATVSQEITWLVDPSVRANAPSADAEPLGLDAIAAAVKRAEPDVIVTKLVRPVKSNLALKATVSRPNGTATTLHVNPYTGAIQGVAPDFDLQQFLRALHGWLLTPFRGGYPLGWFAVAALSLPLLGSLVTGIVVHKKFWRLYARPRLRIAAGARAFWGDFHRLSAVWALPFVAIMGVTACWFLIEAVLFENGVMTRNAAIPPVLARDATPVSPARPPLVGFDQAVKAAQGAAPDLSLHSVTIAQNAYALIEVEGRGAYPLLLETVGVNPYDGAVGWTRRVSDRAGWELVTESMRPLHTGDFAGLWLKLVYFVFGLLLTGLVLSGMMVWTKRTVRATAEAFAAPGVKPRRAEVSP